jgi:hypothetical protein
LGHQGAHADRGWGINGVGNINGKLYLTGGSAYNGDGYNNYRSLQVYDPAANTWTFGADMPVASTSGVADVIDNRLYVLPCLNMVATTVRPCRTGGSTGTIRCRISGFA